MADARPLPQQLSRLCGCDERCGDDGDIDGPGTCKGLPPLPKDPVVEVVLVRRTSALTGKEQPDFGEYHRCDRCGAKDRGQRDWGLDHARRCDGTVTRPPGWHIADASSRKDEQ